MQDGAKCHSCKKTRDYLAGKKVRVLENWPARSPHLNPIENLWAILAPKVTSRGCRTVEELSKAVQEEFKRIPKEVINTLVRSFGPRLRETRQKKGKI